MDVVAREGAFGARRRVYLPRTSLSTAFPAFSIGSSPGTDLFLTASFGLYRALSEELPSLSECKRWTPRALFAEPKL